MASVKQILQFGFLIMMAVIWTIYAMFRMFLRLVKVRGKFFHVEERPTPPSVLTTDWEHGMIALSEVKLHYIRAGSRDKPLMLMLHGFPEFWYSWRHQIKHFQDEYRVVAVDMRGYGDSDKPEGIEHYTMGKLVKDVKELIPALGYSSCVLVAHDWGGAVAWQFVLDNPDIVDKLIMLNCPHPRAFQKHIKANCSQMLKSWYMFFFQTPFLPELFIKANDFENLEAILTDPKDAGAKNPKAFTAQDIEAWKYTFGQEDALTPPINYYRAGFQRPQNLKRTADDWVVQPPTLIIWGTEDAALEREMADLSLEFCRDGTVRYIEGGSHWIQQDEPEQCIEFMQRFLKG